MADIATMLTDPTAMADISIVAGVAAPTDIAPPMYIETSAEVVPTYDLSLAFVHDGIVKRVGWFFIVYPAGSEKGVRLRAKAQEEIIKEITDIGKADGEKKFVPKFRFTLREDAWVDNKGCWGRVIIRTGMTQAERDNAQKLIEDKDLVFEKRRDCQVWVVSCFPELDFSGEDVKFWNERRVTTIYDMEKAINERGLVFIQGHAYVDEVPGQVACP